MITILECWMIWNDKGGKITDIITVPGNPLPEISVMKEVTFVRKEAIVYKNE